MPRLKHHPYLTPVFVRGAYVPCELRGIVRMAGLSDAPIPWPIGEQDGKQALIVYKGLATALRAEAPDAIAALWGVPVATVREWQAALQEPKRRKAYINRVRPRTWQPRDRDCLITAGEQIS